MIRTVFLLFVAAAFTCLSPVKAQRASDRDMIRCYTMEADATLRSRHPELGSLDEFERWLAPLVEEYEARQASGNRVNAVTTIPIIFHVIHNGESVGSGDNIATTYVNAQITQLNNDFRRIVGTSGHNTNSVGADTEVEFCAATVDPSGNPLSTPGVNRINRNSMGWSAPPYGTCSGGNFGDAYIEGTIKPQSQWDPTKYLNIWVMDLTCSILGYAQFPEAAGLAGIGTGNGAANTDGVVVIPASVGSTTNGNPQGGQYGKGRTLTHEIGHWLGLRHIWGDGGCGYDDYCNDTPTSDAPNYGCPTTHVSCSTTDMVRNYMDYTDDDCMNIYTQNQKSRIQTVISNSVRRNTLGSSNGCGTGGGGGNCSTTISSFPYSESFESGLGAWTNPGGDDFDWTRWSGGTGSSGTGPSGAAAGTYYVYTEASSPNYPSKRTYLEGPCFNLSGQSTATFTFQYHMYGAAMGSLNLEVSTNNGSTWSSIWSRSGDQGTNWLSASVSLAGYVGSTVKLRFNMLTGTNYTSDACVDNIQLSTSGGGGGSCTGGITSYPYSESFESGFGQWTNPTGDDLDWTRLSGSTPSSSTGPTSAAAGSYYAYIESSSPNYPSKRSYLQSPCFNLGSLSSATFGFKYHMYGSAMGSLNLEVSTNNGSSWTSVWNASGNQGNSWQTASVNLNSYTGGSIRLRFNGLTGSNYTSDIAVDDISLSSGGGGGGCGTVNISITFDNYPEETSWQILSGSTVIASGGTYGSQPDGSTLNLSECLAAGCYSFRILDSYGDGICCSYGSGSYTVTHNGSTVASGGSFGSSETTAFCVTPDSRSSEPQAAWLTNGDLNLFPNPVTGTLNYAYQSTTDAQAMLRIADLTGRVILQKPVVINAGMNREAIDVQNLPAGSYMLSISHEDALLSKRFVVVK